MSICRRRCQTPPRLSSNPEVTGELADTQTRGLDNSRTGQLNYRLFVSKTFRSQERNVLVENFRSWDLSFPYLHVQLNSSLGLVIVQDAQLNCWKVFDLCLSIRSGYVPENFRVRNYVIPLCRRIFIHIPLFLSLFANKRPSPIFLTYPTKNFLLNR